MVIILSISACDKTIDWQSQELALIELPEQLLQRIPEGTDPAFEIIDKLFNTTTKQDPSIYDTDAPANQERVSVYSFEDLNHPLVINLKYKWLDVVETLSKKSLAFNKPIKLPLTDILSQINSLVLKSDELSIVIVKASSLLEDFEKHSEKSEASQVVNNNIYGKLSKLVDDVLKFNKSSDGYQVIDNYFTKSIEQMSEQSIEQMSEQMSELRNIIGIVPIKDGIIFEPPSDQTQAEKYDLAKGSILYPYTSPSLDTSQGCIIYSYALTKLSARYVNEDSFERKNDCIYLIARDHDRPNQRQTQHHLLQKPYGPVGAVIGDKFKANNYGISLGFSQSNEAFSFYDYGIILASKKLLQSLGSVSDLIRESLGAELSIILFDAIELEYD